MEAGLSGLDTVLVLFRKDLRLDDNPALLAALQAARNVIPVFIWSPEEEGQFAPGRCSRWWIKQSIQALAGQISTLGSRLILRRAEATVDMLLQLLQETGAKAVFFNHLFDPMSLVRDHVMKQQLTAAGVVCRSYNADLMYEPWAVLDSNGEPFTTFKAFWEHLQALPQRPPVPWPAPTALPAVEASIASTPLDVFPFFNSREQELATGQLALQWTPGPEGGKARLEEFLRNGLPQFTHQKARVDRCTSSKLSPWIRMGSISVRALYHKVQAQQQAWLAQAEDHTSSCQDFMQQLAYREYSRYLSFHFPFMHERPLLSHLGCVTWNLDQGSFKAWKMGMTGYPLVDAGMKQLWSSGWMHNRLRVVCGMFAVKYLLLPWQWGLKHYWDQLLDADLESDVLGWQYLSGGMPDAPAFGEWMDVSAEAASFDPDGEYVRRWLPALARLPAAWVHEPWSAPQEVLDAADIELGINYPHPIISQQDAAARLEAVAAAIQQNLEQQQQQQQQHSQQQNSGGSQQQQQQQPPSGSKQPPSGSKQPYRPPTQPTHSYSEAHVAAAAAAAAADLVQQQQQVATAAHTAAADAAADAAAAATDGGDVFEVALAWGGCTAAVNKACDAMSNVPLSTAAAAPHTPGEMQHPIELAPAAAAAARHSSWQQHQPHDEWQVQALQNDGHLRQEHRQQRQRRRQQWQQQQQHGSCKLRRAGEQRHRYGGRDIGVADEEASGDDDDAGAVYKQGFQPTYSEGSEVNSSAPGQSAALPTACSGIMRQTEQVEEDEQQQQQQQHGPVRQLQQQWQMEPSGEDGKPHQQMQEGLQGKHCQVVCQQQQQHPGWQQQRCLDCQQEADSAWQYAAQLDQLQQQQGDDADGVPCVAQHPPLLLLLQQQQQQQQQGQKECEELAMKNMDDDQVDEVQGDDQEERQLLRQQAWMQQLLGNRSDK